MAAPKHGGKRPGAGRPGGNAQYPARLVARVSERDEEWLAAVAAEEGVAPAEVVRWAIADLRRSGRPRTWLDLEPVEFDGKGRDRPALCISPPSGELHLREASMILGDLPVTARVHRNGFYLRMRGRFSRHQIVD